MLNSYETQRVTLRHVALGMLRIAMGWLMFWAFLDKVFGLGFATTPEKSWLNGNSPTLGFLTFATRGPFAPLHQAIAGTQIVDLLFMMGLFGIGLALMLGIAMRIATVSGILLFLLMYSALLPPENNPILDEHIIYIFSLMTLYVTNAGDVLGFGKLWSNLPIVQRFSILKN